MSLTSHEEIGRVGRVGRGCYEVRTCLRMDNMFIGRECKDVNALDFSCYETAAIMFGSEPMSFYGTFTHTHTHTYTGMGWDGMDRAGNSMYFNGGVLTLSYQLIPSHPSVCVNAPLECQNVR